MNSILRQIHPLPPPARDTEAVSQAAMRHRVPRWRGQGVDDQIREKRNGKEWKLTGNCRGGLRTAQCTERMESHCRAVREPPLRLTIYIKTHQKDPEKRHHPSTLPIDSLLTLCIRSLVLYN